MRGKKAIINTIASLCEDAVAIICSFIIPKLILMHFGSEYNGITTSISQFLACAILLRSGIGGATKAALYKPLANKKQEEIESILKATDIFMKKIGIILAISIIIFASVFPFFGKTSFSWLFTFSLFIIIGISTFSESFFGITYLILLQADQRLYISSIIKCICYIINVITASILIINNYSIHAVKFVSALAFSLYPIILNIYVRKKYQIKRNVKPNNKAIEQRWDAFWHQVATFVNSNTDVMVLTVFTNMLEVSVYGVYNLIIQGLKRFMLAFTNGVDSAFGNMIAKNETKTLNDNLKVIEFIVYSVSTLIYSCAILLVLQFISIYTKGINDVNYLRPEFAYILLVAQFFYSIRLPYQYIVQAAGHFKQTKKYAIIEVCLNIILSTLLVVKFGLIGVSIGTLIAMIYKTIMFSNYMSENIVRRSKTITLKKCCVSLIEFIIILLITNFIELNIKADYFSWIRNAVIIFIISFIVIFIGSITFSKKELKLLIYKIKKL